MSRRMFGDYAFITTPAPQSAIDSWMKTAREMGWTIPDGITSAVEGRFYAPGTDDIMALPYELRSTYMRVNGSLRIMAESAFQELCDRVEGDINEAAFMNGDWTLI